MKQKRIIPFPFADTVGEVEQLYKIVRFHFNGPKEIIKEGLTIEEAQAHCEREDTKDPDGLWFDGYDKE